MSEGGAGRLIGTIAGAVIGYFTGGLSYIALGATLGGAAGSLLDPAKKTETGRVDDLRVSLSKYGAGIPETWGNNIPSATCVWSTFIIELEEVNQGGKGGGVQNKNYLQFIQSMWCIGRTPPPGTVVTIRKAWIDGKLTYDASSGLSLAQALATEENPYTHITLLPGYDDQLPVPIIEGFEGVGNVPAFRGRICLFIFGLQVPGGRVPQLQFELCIGAETQIVDSTITTVPGSWLGAVSNISNASVITMLYGPGWDASRSTKQVQVIRISPSGQKFVESEFTATNNEPPASGHSDEPSFVTEGVLSTDLDYHTINGFSDRYSFLDPVYSQFALYARLGAAFLVGWRYMLGPSANAGPFLFDDGGRRDMGLNTEVADVALTPFFIYLMHSGAVKKYWRGDLSYMGDICTVPNYSLNESRMHVVSDDEIYVSDFVNNKVYQVAGADLIERFNTHTDFSNRFGSVFHVFGNALIETYGDPLYGSYFIEELNTSLPGLVAVETPIAPIIESQCDRVGLEGLSDVSTIDDTIWGYTFNKAPGTARGNVAPLLTYSASGQVEEDGFIRFFHRQDHTSVVSIGYDELGCVEMGGEPGDPFPLSRANEAECPRSVAVSYLNPDFDYQISVETAQRVTTTSTMDEQVALDLAMSSDKAATIAHRLLYERWVAQMTRTATVSRKYAYLSPGDVVTFEYPRGTLGNWMLTRVNDTGAVIELESFPADATLLMQTISGSQGFQGQQITPLAPPTRLVIADSAILRDQDNNAGVYAVMAGYFDGWRGAELFAGDDPNSLQSRGTVSNEAPIGYAETELGSYALGNVDEYNLLTVNVAHHELVSITRDELLNGTSNVALIGVHGRWEVIKYQRADSLGSGRYILSGLLRGLQGTEWAAGLHAIGDNFLGMGTAGTIRPNFDVGTISQTKTYRAVSAGRSFNSAENQSEENTGEGLKPLSPTTLRKSFSTNDIVLTWGRRTRLSQQWWLGNVPLGEETEAYAIEIYTTSGFTTLKRTLLSSTPTVTYTSAEQIADFGSNQTTVNVRVYQISGSVGRGHELQQTI